MRITNLNDAQIWDYNPAPSMEPSPSLTIDAKLAQDLCMQHINGLSKISRHLPASSNTQKIAGLLSDLMHEFITVFGSGMLEQNTMMDAVQEYTITLDRKITDPQMRDGSRTTILRGIEQKISKKYNMDPQRLHASFIEKHNQTPYEYFTKRLRGSSK